MCGAYIPCNNIQLWQLCAHRTKQHGSPVSTGQITGMIMRAAQKLPGRLARYTMAQDACPTTRASKVCPNGYTHVLKTLPAGCRCMHAGAASIGYAIPIACQGKHKGRAGATVLAPATPTPPLWSDPPRHVPAPAAASAPQTAARRPPIAACRAPLGGFRRPQPGGTCAVPAIGRSR